MIPLMKNTFSNEYETKQKLIDFINRSNKLSMGDQCIRFEKKFAKFQGTKFSVLFNSGGSANLAMLQVLKNLGKIKIGDKIGFSALTWSTNVMPILQLGFEPIPIDCNPTYLNVMSETLKERLKEVDLKVLFITNVLGFAGDLHVIKQICEEESVILIEDNCESLGTELFTGKTGNFGQMSSNSFYVAHQLSTIEGGMVTTTDEEYAEMLKIVRANGWDRDLSHGQKRTLRMKYSIKSEFESKYTFYDLGYNLRPTEITGFLGLIQLEYLKENIHTREKIYNQLAYVALKNSDLIVPKRSHIKTLSNFAFPIIAQDRTLMRKYFEKFTKRNIEIRPIIAGNIQNQPFYNKYILQKYKLVGADFIHNCGFYCGNYPELTADDIEVISDSLRN